jgi:hypothetical protein
MFRKEVSETRALGCHNSIFHLYLRPATSLALCELHLALTALVLRVMPHMELYDTTLRDVVYDHDMFIPVVAEGSHGVRVVIN